MLENLLNIFDFYQVTRKCIVNNERPENDAEHSWSLTHLYFYLQRRLENEFGNLDSYKILTLISIHDIGEIEIGDIATWNKVSSDKVKELEIAYRELVTKMQRPDLYDLYLEMEEKNPCIEVQIVKSLDRIAPVLLRIYSKIGWHDVQEQEHATKEQLDSRQLPRHQFSKTMTTLYMEAVNYAISKNYFPA